MEQLYPIAEVSYLSAQNATIYRKIMRTCYKEFEKMNYQLYREDIARLLADDADISGASSLELQQWLDQLVSWKNLCAIQDPGRVNTIAEYKNKQFRYSMSDVAVEIERMTVRVENMLFESGNLSTNYFVRLEKHLNNLDEYITKSDNDIAEWWSVLQDDFKRLNQNYQDYLRDFYSGNSEMMMRTMEFVLYKDKFIQYLREFVIQIQRYEKHLGRLICEKQDMVENVVIPRAIVYELSVPHTVAHDERYEEKLKERLFGQWYSLKKWFVDQDGGECECKRVLNITNDIIHSIIQNAAMIVQMQSFGINRRNDYKHFLRMFEKCQDMEEAHKLSAHVFGIQNIEHYKEISYKNPDGLSASAYEGDNTSFALKSHAKGNKEKKAKAGFRLRNWEKMLARKQYFNEVRHQEILVESYIHDGKIDFSKIEDVISAKTRLTFLQWIYDANMSEEKTSTTEYGKKYRLISSEDKCILKCEDGNLTMPAYVLEFYNE